MRWKNKEVFTGKNHEENHHGTHLLKRKKISLKPYKTKDGEILFLQNHSKIQSKNHQNKRYYCLPLFCKSIFIDLNWYFIQSNEMFTEMHIEYTMFFLVLSFYKPIQKYDQQKKKI